MVKKNFKDFLKRNNYNKNEAKIWALKFILKSDLTNYKSKLKALFLLNNKLLSSSKTKIMNRCVLTGRSKSVLSTFRLSWMQFKALSEKGFLPGVSRRNR